MDGVFKILSPSIKSAKIVDRVFQFWQPSIKSANIVDRVFQFQHPSTKRGQYCGRDVKSTTNVNKNH